MKFSGIKAVVLDMDGVLWRGDEPLPGMLELFQWLDESGTPFMLATNNSGKTPTDYIHKLALMGVHTVQEAHIITSGTATVRYMQSRYLPGTRVYIIGMDGLRHLLAEGGFDLTPPTDDDPVQVVVVGIDKQLTYEALKEGTLFIRQGAAFIGTNGDKTFPAPEGLVPGAGSIIAALEAATDTTPVIIGKPDAPMFQAALSVLGTSPEETLMIGDRLNTDIEGGKNIGMKTALLFTGVTTPQGLQTSNIWPDVAYEGLPELLKAWAGEAWYRAKQKAKRL